MNAFARRLALACWVACSPWAVASDRIESHPLVFAKGSSTATVESTLQGGQIKDYRLRARAGQTLSVTLKSNHGANYFNVMPPGSQGEALFVGSSGGNEWSGKLPVDGEYTVRVYLMRSAARRNETARYTLTTRIDPSLHASASSSATPAHDAKVAGTPYHATGQLPCTLGAASQAPASCQFGVIRSGPGRAELHVTPPGGFKRVLTFSSSQVSAGPQDHVKASREGDTWNVDVNDYEHYRIPDAVINGG